MVILLAERFASTVAPARAAYVLGGIGVQTSSQISTWSLNPSTFSASKIKSFPKGTPWPKKGTSRLTA